MGTIYRGVARTHPGYADARRGIVRPRNPDGTTTPRNHSRGEDLWNSPYTSWSHDREIARLHAGEDGLILEWPTGRPSEGSTWQFEHSPDVFLEQEVLVRGTITGARVTEA